MRPPFSKLLCGTTSYLGGKALEVACPFEGSKGLGGGNFDMIFLGFSFLVLATIMRGDS